MNKLNEEPTLSSGLTPETLKYITLRNITTQQLKDLNCQVLIGALNSKEILDVVDDKNVREFKGHEKKATGQTQQDKLSTCQNSPELFPLLNGGVTITGSACKIDNENKRIVLYNPSIINGSQTRGVLKLFRESSEVDIEIKVEFIISPDEDLIQEIAISRNVQDKVQDISILGKKGAWDPINNALKSSPFQVLKNESDKSGGFTPALFIKCAFLLMPKKLWVENLSIPYKKHTLYSANKKFLWIYHDEIFEKKDEKPEIYKYILDISKQCLHLYNQIQKDPDWKFISATKKSGVKKDASGKIKSVSNPWIFPLMAAHSVFVEEGKKWQILTPPSFTLKPYMKMLYEEFYSEVKDVNQLGKNSAIYSMFELLFTQSKNSVL